MNGINKTNKIPVNSASENVVAGIVGAFLFSLVGGVLWFVLFLAGFIAGISGIVGVICAIKGYQIFAKSQSIKGVIIAVVVALLVLVIAWYLCLSYDVMTAYEAWEEEGIVDFVPGFFDCVREAYTFLEIPEIASAYIKDLLFGLLFSAIGAFSCVRQTLASIKQQQAAPTEAEFVVNEGVSNNANPENSENLESTQADDNVQSNQ